MAKDKPTLWPANILVNNYLLHVIDRKLECADMQYLIICVLTSRMHFCCFYQKVSAEQSHQHVQLQHASSQETEFQSSMFFDQLYKKLYKVLYFKYRS